MHHSVIAFPMGTIRIQCLDSNGMEVSFMLSWVLISKGDPGLCVLYFSIQRRIVCIQAKARW